MIECKNEDFESHRSELYAYAMGLLRQRGSGRVLHAEYDEKAKDIVQETYLAFHKSRKDIFVTDFHLKSYLKTCLYNCYRSSVWHKNRVVQYNLFKAGDLDIISDGGIKGDEDEHLVGIKHNIIPSIIYNQEFYDDYSHKFLETLNENQKEILSKLMNGISSSEIYKEKNISRQAFSDSMKYIKKKFKNYENKNS